MIYVFVTFYGFQIHPCISLPKYYEVIVSITMLKVQVRKLKICPRAESWWQKRREWLMDQVLCILGAPQSCSAGLLCFSEALARWYNIMSTSRQNKTADGKLGLIISHLGKCREQLGESVCCKFRSVLNVMSVSRVNEFQRVYVIIELRNDLLLFDV